MKLSECRSEIDRLLTAYGKEEEDREDTRRKTCPIVAPFVDRFPNGGGRVIRSPRILFEELAI